MATGRHIIERLSEIGSMTCNDNDIVANRSSTVPPQKGPAPDSCVSKPENSTNTAGFDNTPASACGHGTPTTNLAVDCPGESWRYASLVVSWRTKECLHMMACLSSYDDSLPENDLSAYMMPLYCFVEKLVHVQERPEARVTSNFSFNHMRLRKLVREDIAIIVADPVFNTFFSQWGIKVKASNATDPEVELLVGKKKEYVLMEIAIVEREIENHLRQWEKSFPRPGPEEILWPEDFTVTEQQTLRHFAKVKLKVMATHLDTQEDRLNAIEEIRWVVPRLKYCT